MSKVVFKVVMMSTHVMVPMTSLEYHLDFCSLPFSPLICWMIGTNTWYTRDEEYYLVWGFLLPPSFMLLSTYTLIINLGCFICIERIMFMLCECIWQMTLPFWSLHILNPAMITQKELFYFKHLEFKIASWICGFWDTMWESNEAKKKEFLSFLH